MNNLFTNQQQSSGNEPQKGNFLIFSSYSSTDSEKIRPILKNILQIKGVRVFFAEQDLNPGDIISEKIKQSIIACQIFLVFYSASAHKSSYVQHEVGFALGQNKIIIPILLDDTKPAGLLSNVHYLDFSDEGKRLIEFSRLYNFIEKSKQTRDRNTLLGLLALAGIGILVLTAGQNRDEDEEY